MEGGRGGERRKEDWKKRREEGKKKEGERLVSSTELGLDRIELKVHFQSHSRVTTNGDCALTMTLSTIKKK